MRRANGLLAAAAAAAVLLSAPPARAATYHNTDYRFSVDVPPGWKVISADEQERAKKTFEDLSSRMMMVTGFRSAQSGLTVLIQVDTGPTSKISFEELEEELNRDFAAAKRGEPEAVLRLARRMLEPNDRAEFDHARGRYTVRSVVRGDRGEARMAHIGYLGPDGLVILHVVTREGGAEEDLATFVTFSDSFRFDEAAKLPPKLMDRVFGGHVGPQGRMAIIGGAIAVLVVLIGAVVMREKPAARWPN